MPKKERIQKRKEKERQETAKSSKSLNAWLQPVTRSKTQERTDNSDAESVRPEREQLKSLKRQLKDKRRL